MSTNRLPDLERFVEQEIASGRFADRNAVVEYALRLFQRDREDAILGVIAGLADAEAGRMQPLDDAFNELRRDFGVSDDA